eukprot:scaffold1161_cov391-Prasinococcus_capsulatus_cf.AAC.4
MTGAQLLAGVGIMYARPRPLAVTNSSTFDHRFTPPSPQPNGHARNPWGRAGLCESGLPCVNSCGRGRERGGATLRADGEGNGMTQPALPSRALQRVSRAARSRLARQAQQPRHLPAGPTSRTEDRWRIVQGAGSRIVSDPQTTFFSLLRSAPEHSPPCSCLAPSPDIVQSCRDEAAAASLIPVPSLCDKRRCRAPHLLGQESRSP